MTDQIVNYDFVNDECVKKILAINDFLENQKQSCDEFKQYISDIAKELATLKLENLNNLDLIQRQNIIISQMSMLLIKIKDIEDKKFHSTLKLYGIELETINENIH